MVTTGQMTGIIMAILLPVFVGGIFYYLFWRKSRKIETGMLGAIGYGALGYVWQELIYSFLGMLVLVKMAGSLQKTANGSGAVLVAAIEALVSAIFVAAGLYWALYLTNTKQQSIYRSATIGIGFGIGYSALTYGFELYYAIRINCGTFQGVESAKQKILQTSVTSLYVSAYRNVVVLLIFLGVALLMGKYYLEKRRLYAWLMPIVVYMFLRFTDVIFNTYLPTMVAKIVVIILFTILAIGSVWIVKKFLHTGEIVIGFEQNRKE